MTTAGDSATNAFKKDTNDGAIFLGKSGAYIYNKTAFGSDISKIEIYSNYNCSASVSVSIDVGTTVLSNNITSDHEYSGTLSTQNGVYIAVSNLSSGYKFFRFQVNSAYNANCQFRITFAPKNTYTVKFNNNGGSGSAADVTKDFNVAVDLPTTGLLR